MIVVFIHQNFPAQYLHIASRLAKQPGNQVYFITQENHNKIPGIRKLVYQPDLPAASTCHAYTVAIDAAVRTGTAVAAVCGSLRQQGIVPDVVVGHCGWGETLFVKDVFPDVPLLSYFEFFYYSRGADVGFDPEFAPLSEGDGARLRIRNTVNRLSFAGSDWGHTATSWQRSLFPVAMQARITSVHEGVDTERVRPDPSAWIRLARENIVLSHEDEVVTYVSRNLEPYRGFHMFMRALPEILRRRPRAHALIVGGDGLSYSEPPPYGGTYREMLLAEVGKRLDLDRVHFLGQVPYETYANVLQVSSVHVHLTYPFVLSWSFVEAMAAGCLVVGSATPPVAEALRDRENGLAVDFFSTDEICDRVDEVLDHPDRMQALRDAARETAIRKFDANTVTLPRWHQLLTSLVERQLPLEEPPDPGLAVEMNQR
ncbi:MAG TPA: glycosyltransferase family 4 protein [Candidatus Sulfotelmatobacter sp.]|jgi:glycosyltransferase involved in cell wall biosynthesis|nr:glycosyltransferase family 4 protein [Candidatus Sulfotelmatobacter sp.]